MNANLRPTPRQDIGRHLGKLARREIQLWSLFVLIVTVIAVAFISMILPNLMWKSEPMRLDGRYLPQLASGFIGLVVLFNLYMFEQKRKLERVREQLTIQLVGADNDEYGIASDPQTKALSREFGDEVLTREANRAERAGSPLTVIVAAIGNLDRITRNHPSLAADHLLLVTANILKTTFRGSDTICRYSTQEFLIILPDTGPAQAQYAIDRLERAISVWNDSTDFAYKLAVQIGVACHSTGDPQHTVQTALADSRKERIFDIFTSKRS